MELDKHLTSVFTAASPIQSISSGNELYAIVVKSYLSRQGHHFVTEPQENLQLGVNHYPAGTTIPAHFHPVFRREIEGTLEMIHVEFGHCRVSIYDEKKRFISASELREGDTMLFVKGGHALEFFENARIIEVKQGPYMGKNTDKTIFSPA